MDIFDNKIEAINLQVTDLENNIQIRFQTIENSVKESASNMEIKMLKDCIKKIEGILEKTAEDSDLDEAFQRLFLLEDLEKERTEQALMQESYDKRFNVLFHGLDEEVNSVWETRIETLEILHQFMRDGLNITDPSNIALADFHRLPQQPVMKDGVKVNRPIIIKLTNAADKHLIFSSLKHLKAHNNKRRSQFVKPQYITEHLPKPFQKERKLLLPAFKAARQQKKKTNWIAENGHYNLYINNIKYELPE